MIEDAELLRRYATDQSEAAFTELIQRHVNLVYSAALRLMNGDTHRAQDVTQQVFTELARQSKRLARHPALAGWLYTTARRMAWRSTRTELRRTAREQEANVMNEIQPVPQPDWEQLRPVLEDAMHELGEKDRLAVLLRYFQNKNLADVGAALGLNENAARMRVERALDKLRAQLARKGVTSTAKALAVTLAGNAVTAAPSAFVATLTSASLATATAGTASALTILKIMAMTKLKLGVIGAVAVVIGAGIYKAHQAAALRDQVQMLRQREAQQLQQFQHERDDATTRLDSLSEEISNLKSNSSELLKLRGEVTRLRRDSIAAERAVKTKLNSESQPSLADQTTTNTPLVKTFSATNSFVGMWDQTFMTGGWVTPSGKRAFVFATLKRGDDAPQLTILTHVVEIPADQVSKPGLGLPVLGDGVATLNGILTSEQYAAFRKAANESDGVDLTSELRVTTRSGVQAQIQAVDNKTSPAGEKYTVGPVIDFIPTISTDGETVDLRMVSTLNYETSVAAK